MAGGGLGALADNLFDFLADGVQGNSHGFQSLGCNALALVNEAEENVLRADVIVVEHARLFLREHNHAACTIGKPLEHVSPLNSLFLNSLSPTLTPLLGKTSRLFQLGLELAKHQTI